MAKIFTTVLGNIIMARSSIISWYETVADHHRMDHVSSCKESECANLFHSIYLEKVHWMSRYFHFLAIVTNSAISMYMQAFLWYICLKTFEYLSRSGIAVPFGSSSFSVFSLLVCFVLRNRHSLVTILLP